VLNIRTSSAEERTDKYFVLGSLVHLGLKLRDMKKLELKVRNAVFDNGIEHWKKVISVSCHSNMDDIIKKLERENFKEARECLKYISNSIPCIMKKRRFQTSFQGVTIEQTDCHIFFSIENHITDIGVYRTISIEGMKIESFLKDHFQNFMKELNNIALDSKVPFNLTPMGYPEFIYRLAVEKNIITKNP